MPATRNEGRLRAALRVVLSHYVANGLSAAFGLLLISGAVGWLLGAHAASVASVGVIVGIAPDNPAPRRGKFLHLLPAALAGLPLFFGVQSLYDHPLYLGLLLVPATFVAFLAGAWGKRGLPIVVSIMFAMIFAMALTAYGETEGALASSLYFALGAGSYLVYATLANIALNGRYRVQLLADALLSLGALMRTLAQQAAPAGAEQSGGQAPLIGRLLKQQAALADQLQAARDIVLESPRTPRRQRLAGMLMQALEMRDHLLACELDIDTLRAQQGHETVLHGLRETLNALADEIGRLADALLTGRKPAALESLRPQLEALRWDVNAPPIDSVPSGVSSGVSSDALRSAVVPSPAVLARGLANRVATVNDEVLRMFALARDEAEPDLAGVRAAWQMFVSPTAWSWRPFLALWRWDAPPLRHAIRAALAIGSAYALSLALPWGTHSYWILVTIVVVLRGSLAQTLERRNSRVAGTLLGCLLAGAILSANATTTQLLVIVTLAQAVAHAFPARRYLVTAVAATVLGLVQAHLLAAGTSPAFQVFERMADTLIGCGIAWAFSYVLPSWERTQVPTLVARTLAAQSRHAGVALGLGQLRAVDNAPELEWRLGRREAYDSLSALVQATQRSLSEPRAVRPPLEPLGRLLAHSHQLLAQLTVVKTILLMRRGQLDPEPLRAPLLRAAASIEQSLDLGRPLPELAVAAPRTAEDAGPVALPDPFESELGPWVLHRLDLAAGVALRMREDAAQVLQALGGEFKDFSPAATSTSRYRVRPSRSADA